MLKKRVQNMFGLNKSAISAIPIAVFIAVFQFEEKSALPITDNNAENLK